jgi:RNA polymerase sigma factor (sigma-70 family)
MAHEEGADQQGSPDAHSQRTGGRSSQIELHDVQLINRIVENDLRAFDALYRNYFPRLARFLDRMTHSTALIEEIINDTMFVVWQKANTYNRTCKVSTWIFSIAYRKGLKAIRGVDDPIDMDFDLVADETNVEPEQAISQRQLQQCVTHALDALPLEQRTVVNLAYYHGMGYQEIAEIMDCPVNTIKTRMFHARKRLSVLLANLME